jgi:hypothetical protein
MSMAGLALVVGISEDAVVEWGVAVAGREEQRFAAADWLLVRPGSQRP